MQTGKSTIKDVFDGTRIFRIPIYQRAYSWEKEDNLKDFLSDVVCQPPERLYFLGSFLFHIRENRNDFTVIDIVDGQQRLTTFIIFINVLIQKLIKKSSDRISERTKRIFVKDGDVFKIETEQQDNAFLHNILNQSYKPRDTVTPSQNLLLEAKEFFDVELGKFDKGNLEKIFKTSTEAEVLLYVVEKINAATQIFELLNDRGRRLTDLESIKSFLMYNAGLVSNKPDQAIQNIQSNFSEIYRYLESYKMNERDVLRYHTIAFEKCPADYQEKPKEYIKQKITKLVNENGNSALEEIQGYSARLKDSFSIYSKIQGERDKRSELSKLFMIGRVAPFYPVLMWVYENKPAEFDQFVQQINRFTFRASLIGLRSNGESRLYAELREKPEDVIKLVERFVSENWWDINSRVMEAVEYENYYQRLSRNTVRYILFSYENDMRKSKSFPLLGSKEYFTDIKREKLSIEHISARRVKNIEYDDEFEKKYMHNIGNLVIDYAGPNSSKGNNEPKDKLQAYRLAPLMSQNEIDDTKCNWKDLDDIKKFIENREQKLKCFIKKEFELSS